LRWGQNANLPRNRIAGTFIFLQPATCNLQPATCNLQPATCNLQPATCNLQPATCNLQPATRNPQPATRNPQPATCNLQLDYTRISVRNKLKRETSDDQHRKT
jgi:hypothetical protein